MAQVKHPKFEGMTLEVEDAEPWLAAGWVETPEPAPVKPSAIASTSDHEASGAPSV